MRYGSRFKILTDILFFAFFIFLSLGVDFSMAQGRQKKPHETRRTKDGLVETLTGRLVASNYVARNGKVQKDVLDYYLEASVQNYFIKFCESTVTKEQLQSHLNKGVSLEVIIKNGEWDSCAPHNNQSRTGNYIRVLSIK